MLRMRSVGEHRLADIAVIDDVLAQPELLVDHGRQRLDPVGIDLAQLLDPAEDIVELGYQAFELLVAHRDPRQLGDVADLFGGNGHEVPCLDASASDAWADSGAPPDLQLLADPAPGQ